MIILSIVFSSNFSSTASIGSWIKYTMSDGSFSFHYPQGWKIDATKSAVLINNAKTDEQLIMAIIPYDKDKSPTDLAKDFVILLNSNNPNVKVSNWQMDPNNSNSQITFDITDKIDQKQYKGSGIVIKDNQHAIWFSYITPASSYSRDRGLGLLQGFITSIASGSSSKNPKVIYDRELTNKIDANAKGFMFILEFALGAPLTTTQERIILDELKSGWRLCTEKEISGYDQYPLLAKSILTMDQKSLNELRIELESSIMEWLEESPDTDKSVKIIKDQLKTRGKEVIAGNPTLTEMSLTAYSEIIAYSRLLKQNPKAMPEEFSQDSVKEIKNQVKDTWKTFTTKEQEQIATSPGLWVCLRTLVNNGSIQEQDKVRSNLVKLTPDTPTTKDNKNHEETQSTESNETYDSDDKPMSMIAHNTLMNIKEMTFNTYMWSQGFNYSINYGKMW